MEADEGQHGAVYVRASDGRCISVFPHLQETFTVLKVIFDVFFFHSQMTLSQLKQDIAKEDGVDCSFFYCAALFCYFFILVIYI